MPSPDAQPARRRTRSTAAADAARAALLLHLPFDVLWHHLLPILRIHELCALLRTSRAVHLRLRQEGTPHADLREELLPKAIVTERLLGAHVEASTCRLLGLPQHAAYMLRLLFVRRACARERLAAILDLQTFWRVSYVEWEALLRRLRESILAFEDCNERLLHVLRVTRKRDDSALRALLTESNAHRRITSQYIVRVLSFARRHRVLEGLLPSFFVYGGDLHSHYWATQDVLDYWKRLSESVLNRETPLPALPVTRPLT